MMYPKLLGTPYNTQELLEDYSYLTDGGDLLIIEKGYETNGADVPRLFWSIVPPFRPKYSPAYLVHDFLLSLSGGHISAIKTANNVWKEMMWKIEPSSRMKAVFVCFDIYWWFRFTFRGVL